VEVIIINIRKRELLDECSGIYESTGDGDTVVGTAAHYGLDGPGTESMWGARVSMPIQSGP